MGAVSCRQGQHTRVSAPRKQGGNIRGPWARGWKSLWCGRGTIRSGLEELWELQRHQEPLQPAPLLLEKPLSEWPVPQFISLFLPEFPMRPVRGQQELKILGLVAKGSFGTVLKVLDCAQEAVFAVKVVPKAKVLQRDTLRQCKEEVSIQRQVNHPFVHSLGDSWQGRRHLFISHLKLTDFGLSRRLSQGARAYTICGTLQYMAPEVLSGGPYNHTADWWSLGVLLFSLATGKFPVAAERDHVTMLASVTHCESEIPASITQELSLLLHELLCQNPLHRLRHLHHFRVHPFFRGVAFDPELLKKQPVSLVMETQDSSSPLESKPFKDFDCDLESLVHSVSADSLLQIGAQLET
ncbi:ribosomal protein S6 kinase-related protein isoform X4 [Onychomys torridus]|uniref:ribosomal protein S6 kinase-related protein isoform X4 n=1 Tax=Onychomys torridus TaxID=38674 RepID=UPI00167F5EB1|nr:ribosomal protein S6 kinase-related protein isoform X4 [Onychomys torridus]